MGIRLRKLLAESFVLLKKWSKKASDCLEVLNSDSWWLRSHLVEYGVVVDSKGNVVHEVDIERLEEPGQKTEDSFNDDFWQVVKHEKLGEGDFEVEISMSFGGSHWCRPMSMDAHRSTDQDEDRSMDYSRNRSTSSAQSIAECSAVRIMTHEEFTEKHTHPPSPFYVKIDRPLEPAINRQIETNIDRPPSPLISHRSTGTSHLPITTPEPMQVDEATEGRVLRKRKEKIPKHLKREANEKEMDGFTKRVLRIPVEKHFDEVYYTHRLWMFFRETKETEEDIRRMFHHVRERMKLRITLKKKSDPGKFAIPCVVKGIEFPHALCDTGASVNLVELGNDLGYIAACHCGAEYKTEYSEMIDTHTITSIDSNESPTTDERYPTSLDGKQPVDHSTLPDQYYPDFTFQQPNKEERDYYSIGSWADSGFHESFAVETVILSSNEDPTEE
ncbi:hypothetical protein F2Q68_00025316 [Brassica cretica]|uniref:Aspartic peptidase DDI1-type domain-containing protein n=1 Tax=Brassica cretica TaxID=69181 RepID=A0A8S9ID00_BRACR|nr:hypothetical protein F2Q68_00025316 [Brassica cretica]